MSLQSLLNRIEHDEQERATRVRSGQLQERSGIGGAGDRYTVFAEPGVILCVWYALVIVGVVLVHAVWGR